MATSVEIWKNAPRNSIFHSLRSGPTSSVYRATLESQPSPCVPNATHTCAVAINGFGTVGEVHFSFSSRRANAHGRSTQVMVACRCLGPQCVDAVLMRPVNVMSSDGKKRYATCVYEAIEGNFTNCYAELLRLSTRHEKADLPYVRGKKGFFEYNVTGVDDGTSWNATGQRGWTYDCKEDVVNALQVVNLTDVLRTKAISTQYLSARHIDEPQLGCRNSNTITYYREESVKKGRHCAATYGHAANAAAHKATQQDEIGIGNWEDSYFTPKLSLASDTDLALSCSAAALGILVLWAMYRKQNKKKNTSWCKLAIVISAQIITYGLESLPLHTVLGSEINARHWASQFAFVDGTLALGRTQRRLQGSARDSVLIMTAILGDVKYVWTREETIAILTGLFDMTAIVLITLTLVTKVRYIRKMGRGLSSK